MRPDSGQYESTTLRDYLRVVRRRKWLILQAVVLVPLAAVLLSLRQEPLYQSSADVLLSRQNIAAALNGIAADPSAYYLPDRVAQTQAQLARVPALAERVVRAADVDGLTTYGFLASSSVSADPNSDLLRFRVNDLNPELAIQLATEYAQQYTRYKAELETTAIVRARNDLTAKLASLDAEGEDDTELYRSLVEKEQQLRTIEALQTDSAFVVRPADTYWQIRPNPVRNGVLALLVGIVLGIAIAFLRDALDTRVRSTEEIEELGLPLLARLPEPPRRLRRDNKLVMLEQPNSVQAEAFRMLKTNLEFVNLERHARVIMTTSAIESEGKSTTVANLAVALARAGSRVILVDLDLRRPILDRFFDLRRRPGVTQVVLGHSELNDALTNVPLSIGGPNGAAPTNGKPLGSEEGSLHVLGSGPIPPHVGEFVGTEALARLLRELAARADFVLIDAPPLLHVGDTRVLCARVDGIILVTRLSVLRRPMVKEVERVLRSCPAEKLGFAITGAEQEADYGQRRYYTRADRTPEISTAEKETVG